MFVECTIFVEDIEDGQLMALADFEVVGIVCRCNFEGSGAEGRIDIGIGDDRNSFIDEWNQDQLADPGLVAFVIGMHGDGGIRHDGFRSLGSNNDALGGIGGQGIADMKKPGIFLFVNDFFVGEYGFRFAVPVGHAAAPVDFTFIEQVYEDLGNGIGEGRFHGKPGSFPIAGSPQAFELIQDDAPILFLPVKGMLQKSLAADC